MVTLADVAKKAGVSMMTVSRVINGSGNVSEKTRRIVQDAIDDLSYRPNMLARGLATSRSRMIAYAVTNLANPFFADVSMGIENICVKHGYSVIICDVSSDERLSECVSMLIERRLDGVIFHHLNITEAHAKMLEQNSIHCVTIDNETDLDEVSSVNSDDYEGARRAVRHLVECGHRKIGCIHGHYDSVTMPDWSSPSYAETFQRRIWRDRTQGFLDEMRASGLEPVIMAEGRGSTLDSMIAGGYSMQEILHQGERMSAIYCENDFMALGALGECLKRSIRTPEDIAIVGHDGLNICMELYPRITTVHQPKYHMGCMAAEQLIGRIEERTPVTRQITASEIFRGDTT